MTNGTACLITKDDIIIRCQTKATINTVKTYLKTKHDPILQSVTVKYTVKAKTPTAAVSSTTSKKQYEFSNGLFASNITYTCGAYLTRGNSKRCDNKTKGMKFCYAHRVTEDEKTLHQNVWNNGESTEILAYNASANEVLANRSLSFTQMVCRFVGELNMNVTVGSAVKAKNCHSICEPDWGNRMSIGSIEEANCCIEYNDRLEFVVRMVRDIEADENFVLYDEVCEAMYIDEHVEF